VYAKVKELLRQGMMCVCVCEDVGYENGKENSIDRGRTRETVYVDLYFCLFCELVEQTGVWTATGYLLPKGQKGIEWRDSERTGRVVSSSLQGESKEGSVSPNSVVPPSAQDLFM